MFRNALRRASTFKIKSAPSTIPRTSELHALNLKLSDVSEEVDAQYRKYRLANHESKIRVNRFLHCVFINDVPGAVEILGKLRQRCIQSADSATTNLYLSCLVTLAAQASSGKELKIQQIQIILDEVKNIPQSVVKRDLALFEEICLHIIVILLRKLQSSERSKGRAFAQLVAQARTFCKSANILAPKILQHILHRAPDLVSLYNILFGANEKAPNANPAAAEINKFKSMNGSLTYKRLCEFISSVKLANGNMLELYDNTPEDQKAQFMKRYLEFNKQKQLVVEEHCEDIRGFSRPPLYLKRSKYGVHELVTSDWVEQLEAAVKEKLEIDKVLLEHTAWIEVVTAKALADTVVNTIVTQTAASGSIPVLLLFRGLSKMLTGLIHRKVPANSTSGIISALSEQRMIELSGSLVKMAVDSCKVLESNELAFRPAFKLQHQRMDNSSPAYKRAGVLHIDQELAQTLLAYSEFLQAGSYHFPMLCPPRKWTGPENGGFLETKIPLVRSSDPRVTSRFIRQADQTGQLESIYLSLDRIGSIGWAVNPDVLAVFESAMKNVHGFLNLPPPMTRLMEELTQKCPNGSSKALRKKIHEQRALRISYELMFHLARAFASSGDVMYFPQNLDFRGRVYPAVSFLSVNGEDLSRALLMFWEAKPLGKHGHDWLQYQLANLYCKGKISMKDAKAFVKKNRENIESSAKNPMAPMSWWTSGESPWMSLALCTELNKIWDFLGNIWEYKCRIPIHQDGTCNGLQHYAALGGDIRAAKSVNLTPSDTRNDVYTSVLQLVEGKVENDVKSGNETAAAVANLLNRKLIKQTVMTTVYGVTQYGATQQVQARLAEAGSRDLNIRECAQYVAHKVLSSISELFEGAKRIQDWLLRNCQRTIYAFDSKNVADDLDVFGNRFYRPMMWTAISGLPVVQVYRRRSLKVVKTPLLDVAVSIVKPSAPIDIRKQENAIAPNFIHSLDSMHLLMTSLASQREGIAFAAVHDSFWTHPGDVETLSRIIREEFVRLHKSPILENLRADLQHINRSCRQLVWAENDTEFAQALRRLRGDCSKQRLKAILREELKESSEVDALIARFRPRFIFNPSLRRLAAFMYHLHATEVYTGQVSVKSHTPVLVPVKITHLPERGDFDVSEVLKSIYFFS